jgi:transcriptional regulator with XRE-family HTH domain
MTQAELAEAIGITSDEVSRIERGAREPRFATLERTAQALQVEVGRLLETADVSRAASPISAYRTRMLQLEQALAALDPPLADAALDACLALARRLGRSGRRKCSGNWMPSPSIAN